MPGKPLRLALAVAASMAWLGYSPVARSDSPGNGARKVLGDPTYQTDLPRPGWSGEGESFGGGSFPPLSFGGGDFRGGTSPGGGTREPNVDDSWGDGPTPPRSGGHGDGMSQPGGGQPGGDGAAPPPAGTGSGDGPSAANQPPRRSARRNDTRREIVPPPSAPSAAQEVASTFAVLFLAVVLFAIFAFVISRLFRARHKLEQESAGADEVAASEAPEVRREPNEADLLAAEGRFDEAVHVLLVCALQRLAARSERPLSDSLTSREILRHVSAGPPIREALESLVRAVESSLFGDATLSRSDYDRCLSSFHVVTEAS